MQAVIGKFYKTLKAARENLKPDEEILVLEKGVMNVKRSVMSHCEGKKNLTIK